MAASSWIIPAILFGLGILIGYYLAKKHQHHLSDLKEGVNYFQDIPPSRIFFLREEGSSIKHVFIHDNSLNEAIFCNGNHTGETFLIRRRKNKEKDNEYTLTYL